MNRLFFVLSIVVYIFLGACRQQETKENDGAIKESYIKSADSNADSALNAQPIESTSPPEMNMPVNKDTVNHYRNSQIEVRTIKNDPSTGGYGYDIVIDGKVYIHQPHIPAVPGNSGFSSELKARKAADLMVYKIRHNIMPPALDIRELDSLGVLN